MATAPLRLRVRWAASSRRRGHWGALMNTDRERIEKALAAGWTHIMYASDKTVHPMAGGCRSAVKDGVILSRGDREIICGTPPGQWVDKGNGIGSGPSEELPELGGI